MNRNGNSMALAMYLYVTKNQDTYLIRNSFFFFWSLDFKAKIYCQNFHAKITRNFFF